METTLEKWLYNNALPPKQTRQKPMKVLALGMSRSGTESMSRALRILGYDHVFHGFEVWSSSPMLWRPWTMLGRRKWGANSTAEGTSDLTREDFDALLGDSEAITDQPGTLFAPELIKAYPEAKVILNRRDVDTWYRSFCTVLRPLTTGLFFHVLPWFNADLYWEARYMKECQLPFFHGSWARHGKWVYEEHSAVIRGSVPPENLLEWTVEDGWEPLCKFLGKEIPPDEFPWGNTVDNTLNEHDNDMVTAVKGARRNLGLTLCCLGGLVVYAVVGCRVGWRWVQQLDVRACVGTSMAIW